MSPKQLEESIATHLKSKADKRHIKNIAAVLFKCLKIPMDSSLICFIGNGDEKDNHEALETWVKKELQKFPDDIGDPIDYLYAKFCCELTKYSFYE